VLDIDRSKGRVLVEHMMMVKKHVRPNPQKQIKGGIAERESFFAKNPNAKGNLQRYKGLGEMNPEQLWETTMNPENRTLLQVQVEDAAEADRTFDMLMGSSVPPRRRFIQTHAHEVQNLDV